MQTFIVAMGKTQESDCRYRGWMYILCFGRSYFLSCLKKKRENIAFQESNATIHTWNVSNFMSVMSFSYMIFCTIMFTLISPTIIILYTLIGIKIFQKFSESQVSNRAKDHAINNVENKMSLPEVIYTKEDLCISQSEDMQVEATHF